MQFCATFLFPCYKSAFEYIPVESHIEKFQDKYYDVIDKCHVDGCLENHEKKETIGNVGRMNEKINFKFQVSQRGLTSRDFYATITY